MVFLFPRNKISSRTIFVLIPDASIFLRLVQFQRQADLRARLLSVLQSVSHVFVLTFILKVYLPFTLEPSLLSLFQNKLMSRMWVPFFLDLAIVSKSYQNRSTGFWTCYTNISQYVNGGSPNKIAMNFGRHQHIHIYTQNYTELKSVTKYTSVRKCDILKHGFMWRVVQFQYLYFNMWRDLSLGIDAHPCHPWICSIKENAVLMG